MKRNARPTTKTNVHAFVVIVRVSNIGAGLEEASSPLLLTQRIEPCKVVPGSLGNTLVVSLKGKVRRRGKLISDGRNSSRGRVDTQRGPKEKKDIAESTILLCTATKTVKEEGKGEAQGKGEDARGRWPETYRGPLCCGCDEPGGAESLSVAVSTTHKGRLVLQQRKENGQEEGRVPPGEHWR